MIRHVLPVALAASFLLPACTVRFRATASLYVQPAHAQRVARECPPLETLTETQTAKTDSRSVWVAGHFRYDDDWVWIEGTWIVGREGYQWEPPVCVVEDGAHRFHPGYFRRDEQTPPPAYRQPGHIRMSCPSDTEPDDVPERIVLSPGVEVPPNTGAGVTIPTGVGIRPADPSLPDVDRPTTELPAGELPSSDPNLPGVDRPTTELPGAELPSTDPNLPGVDRPTTNVPGAELPNTNGSAQGVRCELVINRVPADGYVNIRGTGFTPDARVMISGNNATIRRRSETELVVGAQAGMVSVYVDENRYECGAVELIHIPARRPR